MRKLHRQNHLRVLATIVICVLAGVAVGMAQTGQVTGVAAPGGTTIQPTGPTAGGPTIALWYGHRQTFRKIGVPIRWANVLGNVSDPDGVASLSYTLNGGASQLLSIGPDQRRLYAPGDFNVEMSWDDLLALPDSNRVIITAVDNLANISSDTVIVRYQSGTTWPRPYASGWSSVNNLLDSAQVIDGNWAKDGIGIHPLELGYDRVIGFGDSSWTDYEVLVPVTIHSIDPDAYNHPESGYPAVGILMRWTGATDDPVPGKQPHEGFNPYGVIGYYSYRDDYYGARLELLKTGPRTAAEDLTGKKLQFDVAYNFKLNCQTVSNGTVFKFRVWQVGQTEPTKWDLSYLAPTGVELPTNGSFALLAHHVDASFGRVSITNISPDNTPPVITNVRVIPGRTSAVLTWSTDEPATSNPDWGSPTYTDFVLDTTLVTFHKVILPNLKEQTVYHYMVTSVDAFGNSRSTGDATFTTTGPSDIISDSFNSASLNTSLWTYHDPLGDATQSMTGSQLSLALPAGTIHDAFDGPNTSVRILQPATNTDFEVEAKFDSPMTEQFVSMGIIVAQDGTNYLRFDAYADGSDLRLFAGRITNGSGQVKLNVPIAVKGTAPVWLRLKKVTNLWTESYSFNGKDFTEGITFGDDLIMDSIGVLAANSGGSPPAFTALFDYFRNTEVVKAALGLKLFLEGPFNTSTNLMSTALKSGGTLATKFPGVAIPASAVDSINIEIRNATSGSGSTYRRYAPAWLMADGSIRAFSDTAKSYVEFDTTGGSFYIVVRHRNHISIMSSATQAISFAPVVYDFSTAQSKATGTNPMKKVSTSGASIYALYTGNVTPADQIINAQDRLVVKNALLQTGYVIADVNLNGTVNATDRLLVKNNLLITSYVP